MEEVRDPTPRYLSRLDDFVDAVMVEVHRWRKACRLFDRALLKVELINLLLAVGNKLAITTAYHRVVESDRLTGFGVASPGSHPRSEDPTDVWKVSGPARDYFDLRLGLERARYQVRGGGCRWAWRRRFGTGGRSSTVRARRAKLKAEVARLLPAAPSVRSHLKRFLHFLFRDRVAAQRVPRVATFEVTRARQPRVLRSLEIARETNRFSEVTCEPRVGG